MIDPHIPSEPKRPPFDTTFFSTAFSQTKDIPASDKSMHGKFFDPIQKILQDSDSQLKLIRADLPGGLLKPKNDMGIVNYEIYMGLPPETREQIDRLRDGKQSKMNQLIENQIKPSLSKQTLPTTVLTSPTHFCRQENKRTCVTANFRMIFEAITGESVEESVLLEAAKVQGMTNEGQIAGEYIDDKTLFDVFNTQAFKERYPNTGVRSMHFYGNDFDDIAYAQRILREKAPNVKVYCRVSLASEVVTDGWHDVILLSADESTVTMHDPSSSVGGAYKTIPKDQFIERWGKTFLSGDLLIVSK